MLKVSGLPGGLKRHRKIAEELDKAGLQASLPMATEAGELLVQEGDVYALLCRRVQGSRMSGREMFSSCDENAAYRFGMLIGKLHLALAQLDAGLCEENCLQDTIQSWALPYVVLSIQLICVAYFAGKEEFAGLAKVNEKMLTRLIESREKLISE